MIGLGWAQCGASAPPPCTAVDLPFCSVIAVAEDAGATPRDRLRLQVSCARTLAAFLPLRPTDRVTLDEATARALADGPAVAGRLADVTGRVQVTLFAQWTPPPLSQQSQTSGSNGRQWLAVRAATHTAKAERQADLAKALRAALITRMSGPVHEQPRPGGLQLDGLVEAAGVEDRLAALAGDLAGLRLETSARLTVTGPWPVLSFAHPGNHAA